MHRLIGKAGTPMDSEKLSSQTVLNCWKSVNQRVSDLIAEIREENIQNEVAPGVHARGVASEAYRGV
jgi:hypothetical protein